MYICICEQVTDKQIKNAINNGARSMRELRNELGIAKQCGQCGQCAKALIKEHKEISSSISANTFSFFDHPVLVTD